MNAVKYHFTQGRNPPGILQTDVHAVGNCQRRAMKHLLNSKPCKEPRKTRCLGTVNEELGVEANLLTAK